MREGRGKKEFRKSFKTICGQSILNADWTHDCVW